MLGVSSALNCQEYYYNNGEKISLQRGDQFYIVFDEKEFSDSEMLEYIGDDAIVYSNATLKWGITKPSVTITDKDHVFYQASSYRTETSTEDFFLTHRFYVKIKKAEDLTLLQNMAKLYNAEIEKEQGLPLWYIMQCGLNSSYNALELANKFYEEGKFTYSQPEFIGGVHVSQSQDIPTSDGIVARTSKILRGTQILIEREDKIYMLTGQEVK
jgi:hypothetical protein